MSEVKKLPIGWEIATLEDMLNYIQPTNYIVETTDYNDSYKTPVLTAGKSFILGYTNETDGIFTNLPTIIFDDFTTAIKWVNFPFKVKSSAMKILIPKYLEVNMKFVFYFMETMRLNVDTHKRYWISVGAKQNIPLPPLPEQHRIVAKIEALFSSLDKGIESLKTAQAQLKIYRQAVLKWAFEGKLTNKNVIEGELPKGWLNIELSKITEKAEKVKPKEKKQSEKFIYLDIGGIDNKLNKIVNHKIFQWKDAPSRAQQIVKVGDTLFSTVRIYLKNIAVVDKTIFENQICSSGFTVIRAKENKSISKYLNYYSIFEEFIRPLNDLQKGTSYPAIRSEDVFNQFINLPPTLSEQTQIVAEIESRLSVCDKIEESISTSLLQAEALRQSILKKAFEGNLVAQDPNDEPASNLLKKIKAEKKIKNPAERNINNNKNQYANKAPAERNINRPPAERNINRPPAERNINRPPAERNINRPPAERNINRPPAERNINNKNQYANKAPAERNFNRPPAERNINNKNQYANKAPAERNINRPPAERNINRPPAERNINRPPAERNINRPPAERINIKK